jgi:hypothetical protein
MSEQPVMLKILLRDRHWQNYGTFCTEYDKAARRIDPDLTGRYPSRSSPAPANPAGSSAWSATTASARSTPT